MTKKILLIDDDAVFVKMLKTRMEVSGFEVVIASDGEIGFQQWEQEKPDLIILDIAMPNMDGYTFVRESKQKENLKKIPILVLTGKEGMNDLFALEGVQDYFVKMMDTQKLLARVCELLR